MNYSRNGKYWLHGIAGVNIFLFNAVILRSNFDIFEYII